MKAFLLAVIGASLLSVNADAQTYKPFVPGSNYACITMPDGTVQIGFGHSDGYSLVAGNEAKNTLNARARAAKSRIERLTELKEEIKSHGTLGKQDAAKSFKAFAKFVNGKVDPTEVIPRTKEEQLALVSQYIQEMKQIQTTAKFEVKAVDYCFEKKLIVPPGDLTYELVATSSGIAAVLWGRQGAYNTGNYYCSRGSDTSAITVQSFRDDPCSPAEFSCLRKGYVGIYLGGVGTDHPLSQEDIAYYSVQVTENLSPAYEIKVQTADKHYKLNSCEDILINSFRN